MSQSGRVDLLKKNQTQRPEQRLDIFTKLRHRNALPTLPMDPKFLELPFSKLPMFVMHKTTELQKNHRYGLTTERDLDINVDLIDSKRYEVCHGEENGLPQDLHPEDLKLVQDDTKQNTDKRRANHNEAVSWMRKTQYLGIDNARYGVGADRQETKVGYKLLKSGQTDSLYKDRDSQIEAINKTFKDIKKPIKKHPTKKNVYAVEEMPVLPDTECWHLPYSQVLFDSDPIPFRKNNKDELMEHAVIQGLTDAFNKAFVAYFAPSDQTLKRLQFEEESGIKSNDRLEYKLGREYNWTIKNCMSNEFDKSYFFTFRNGCAYYNDIDSRVKLTRRPKGATADTMLIKNVEITDAEQVEFDNRKARLNEREVIDEAGEQASEHEESEREGEPDGEDEAKKREKTIFGDNSDESSSSSSSSDDDSSDDSSESEAGKKSDKSDSKDSDSDSSEEDN